ncbi:MAG: YbaB/EbfC family nucleoid-associated protein [Kiritimatiellae bacterium]|nr:YbaB/EbfC family nucleoid-associated protein [Kiritimatiellia bacterium]MDD5520240.1 YbaB/EbfC family nucleoid-associated protein [Kiritimatiellia bacterium]
MANMFEMMKQAMSMQKDLKNVQKQLAKQTIEYAGKSGLVKVVSRGDMTIESMKIDPQLINAADTGRLEQEVVSAVNGALLCAKEKAGKEMSKLTAGMGLPDIFGM